jgi:hypothetical protein
VVAVKSARPYVRVREAGGAKTNAFDCKMLCWLARMTENKNGAADRAVQTWRWTAAVVGTAAKRVETPGIEPGTS